jgi:hypothetical protein
MNFHLVFLLIRSSGDLTSDLMEETTMEPSEEIAQPSSELDEEQI